MARGLMLVVFVIAFIAFAIIKMVMTGTKAAYEAVFDPNAKDERIARLIMECMYRVDIVMKERYKGDASALPSAILHLTPVIQSMILEAGYKAPTAMARSIVCEAIVKGNHASQSQVEHALQMA